MCGRENGQVLGLQFEVFNVRGILMRKSLLSHVLIITLFVVKPCQSLFFGPILNHDWDGFDLQVCARPPGPGTQRDDTLNWKEVVEGIRLQDARSVGIDGRIRTHTHRITDSEWFSRKLATGWGPPQWKVGLKTMKYIPVTSSLHHVISTIFSHLAISFFAAHLDDLTGACFESEAAQPGTPASRGPGWFQGRCRSSRVEVNHGKWDEDI